MVSVDSHRTYKAGEFVAFETVDSISCRRADSGKQGK